MRSNARLAVVLAVLVAVSVALQIARDSRYTPPGEDAEAVLYVRSPEAMRRLSLSFTALAADLDWIRAVQHYGGDHGMPVTDTPKYLLLYPLLDRTTTLDPRFNIAYRFGAIFLAEAYPSGPGRPDLAIDLLKTGLRERPDKWEYMEDIAFVHYWYEHDYIAASEWFEKAGAAPGAPWWMKSMAATTRARGGDRNASRLMWEAIRQTTEIPWLRQDAEQKLEQLRALDEIDLLQRIVDEVAAKSGQRPGDWGALVRARALGGVPVDPRGTPYELTPEGRVRLSQSSPLFPLLVEPPSQTQAGAGPR